MEEYEEEDIEAELLKPSKSPKAAVPAPKVKEEVKATQVVTQTSPAFRLPDGEVVTLDGLLIWVSNQILAIRRAVA